MPGNESADFWVRMTVGTVSLQNFSVDLRALAKTHLDKSWNSSWVETKLVNGKFYVSIQPGIPRRLCF